MNYLPRPTPARDRDGPGFVLEQEPTETWIDARQELFALKCEISHMALAPAWRMVTRAYHRACCCLATNSKVRVR